jgi:diguanylate cyclase (GGDEF)-like protein
MLDKVSPFRSVRARFSTVMGGSGIVLGLALTLFMEWHLEAGLQASARDSLNAFADEIAHKLTEDLSNRQREVVLMADLIGRNNTVHPEASQDVIEGLKHRQAAYAWIGLIDQAGVVLAASGGFLKGLNVSARPWFAGGMQGDFVADPHDAVLLAKYMKPRADGEPPRFLDVAAPIKDGAGGVQGVLAAHLHWDWVNDVVKDTLAKRRKSTPLEVFIANRKGEWLLGAPSGSRPLPANLQAVNADEDYLVATQKIVTKVPADGLGWTVVVREDLRYAFAPIDEVRRLMLAFTALVAGLFAWASWLIAGRVVRPIVQLADAAKSHAGDLSVGAIKTPGWVRDETGVLGQAMDRLAHNDRLTGLFNRSEMLSRLHHAILRTTAQQSYGALLLVNLDNVSVLNNTRGHDAGDQLLIATAKRLQQLEDSGALVARLGGDEFLMLLESLGNDRAQVLEQAIAFAARTLAQFRAPFALETGAYQGQTSIGVALVGDELITADDVLKRTELAMLEAKKRGKNQAVVFDQRMQDELFARVQFEEALRNAIPSQLLVLYQPQIDLQKGLLGAEVLVRWQHPVQGLISPARFIPLAEETGWILPIGQWVLGAACRQLRLWAQDPARAHLVLAVNVSVKEFRDPAYVQSVGRILQDTGANPHRLKLELTESVLAVDVDEVVGKMQALKAIGISFSLDDFGTGFSSLSYLKRMPLDQLKIDQSFVRDFTTHASDASIVRTVIALGQGLGLEVIAEGVETAAQQSLLQVYGCTSYQGCLYGRPAPIEQFEAEMAQWAT